MTKELITRLRDDMDGRLADDVATREFSVNGTYYEIELSEKNHAEMLAYFAYYTSRAREVKPPSKRKGRARKSPNGLARVPHVREEIRDARDHRQRIREWANKHGFNVGSKGIIATEAREAYYRAHPRVERLPQGIGR